MEIYKQSYELNTKVNYDFYKKYLGSNHFKEKFESRIEYIKNKYENNKISDDKLIEQYFVEIFSWSVIPRDILSHIQTILRENNIQLLMILVVVMLFIHFYSMYFVDFPFLPMIIPQ